MVRDSNNRGVGIIGVGWKWFEIALIGGGLE